MSRWCEHTSPHYRLLTPMQLSHTLYHVIHAFASQHATSRKMSLGNHAGEVQQSIHTANTIARSYAIPTRIDRYSQYLCGYRCKDSLPPLAKVTQPWDNIRLLVQSLVNPSGDLHETILAQGRTTCRTTRVCARSRTCMTHHSRQRILCAEVLQPLWGCDL